MQYLCMYLLEYFLYINYKCYIPAIHKQLKSTLTLLKVQGRTDEIIQGARAQLGLRCGEPWDQTGKDPELLS